MRDLFDGKPASPEQPEGLAAQRKIREVLERGLRLRDREKRDGLWRLERLRDALGAKLARFPDDAEVARLFHAVCIRIGETEPAIYPGRDDGPSRMESPPAIASWMAVALSEISQNFNQKENQAAVRAA